MTAAEMPVADEIDRFEHRAKVDRPQIEREGGKFGAGIIRGVSLATVGEALGHEYWLDAVSIEQISQLASGKGDQGLKARFTHPGLSSDGMGRFLGRIHDVRVSGEKAIGDLHLAQAATDTPDGNLAEYVLTLTEEDAAAAGLSIVFHHDFEAEEAFASEYQVDVEFEDSRGRKYSTTQFKSPDPRNQNDYPHVRMTELRAADIVDEPAANPDGLFDASPLARQADAFLSYAAGISDDKPESDAFSIDGDRASQFFTRWLSSHGLQLLTEKEVSEMSENQQPAEPEAVEVTRESLLAEQSKFVDRFGAEDGVKWFSEGKKFTDCLGLLCDKQSEEIAKLQEQVGELEEKLAAVQLGEEEPIETLPQDGEQKKGLASKIRIAGSPSRN